MKNRTVALLLTLVMLSALLCSCAGSSSKITVALSFKDNDGKVLFTKDIEVSSKEPTVADALAVAIDEMELDADTDDTMTVTTAYGLDNKDADGKEYFWDFNLNGEAVGSASDSKIADGDKIEFTYLCMRNVSCSLELNNAVDSGKEIKSWNVKSIWYTDVTATTIIEYLNENEEAGIVLNSAKTAVSSYDNYLAKVDGDVTYKWIAKVNDNEVADLSKIEIVSDDKIEITYTAVTVD